MSVDPTLIQNPDDLRQAQARSLERMRPPTHVPGYEPVRFLGAGAYGEVWVAVDRNTGRQVAIKFYTHRGGLDWTLLSREVEKLSFLFADRYVVQLIDVGWDADPPFYVMEFLENGSLAERLKQGPMPVEEAVALFREVGVGLVHAHGKGVLHCDLKPANVLLDQDHKPRLADFGQSRLSSEQTPSLGTLFYMAPEQASLEAVPEARWDVYALGALLYAMLTGDPPYRTDAGLSDITSRETLDDQLAAYRRMLHDAPKPTAHRRVPGVDRELAEIIDRCLSLNTNKRFANPQAVLGALKERASRRTRRPLLVLGAVLPFFLFLVGGAFGLAGFRTAIGNSTQALVERALESNRFAAQFVAETVARQVDRRWQILEQEASDSDFRQIFLDAVGKPRSDPARQRLQQWLEDLVRRNADLAADSWFLTDGEGTQIARVPLSLDTIDRDFSYRDYFHGQGGDLPRGTKDIKPIQDVHRSNVFVSSATGAPRITFSAPVWNARQDAADRRVVGVIAASVNVGHFTELRSDSGANEQVAVLVDTVPVAGDQKEKRGRKGAVLEHPHVAAAHQSNDKSPSVIYVHDQQVAYLEKLRAERRSLAETATLAVTNRTSVGDNGAPAQSGDPAPPKQEDSPATQTSLNPKSKVQNPKSSVASVDDDYRDPIGEQHGGQEFAGRWLAAFEPVFVERGAGEARDTGWVVAVQERYADAVRPASELRDDLMRQGALAVPVFVVVLLGIWMFVIWALNESPRSRWTSIWQGRFGMGQSSMSSGSGSATTTTPSSSSAEGTTGRD